MKIAMTLSLALLAALILGGCDDDKDECIHDGGKVKTRQEGIILINNHPYPRYVEYCVTKTGKEYPLR